MWEGLWPTVPETSCALPFIYNSRLYSNCRHSVLTGPLCGADFHSCYLPNGRPSMCMPSTSNYTSEFNSFANIDLTLFTYLSDRYHVQVR
jgi:hypothetical protein